MAAPMKTLVEDDPEPWAPTHSEIDPLKEEIVLKEIKRYINKLESSQFYHDFRDQLQTPPMSEHLHRVLGSESKMRMIIYGIGKIELNKNPRWQLSFAILMKKDFKWIGDIEVFDPLLSATECKILKALGCFVSSLNEYGKRKALKPTMFFMPHCSFTLYNNLLQANWKLDLLNNIVLFGNRLKTLNIHHMKYISTAKKFTLEFLMRNDDYYAFKDLSWQFFSPIQFMNDCALNGGRIEMEKCDGALKGDKIERKNSNKVEILKETLGGLTNLQIDLNREKTLMQKVKICMENFESSHFYYNFRDKLKNPHIFEFLSKVLGLESKMQIVIYGINKLEESVMLHLCLAILMKKDFKWIEDIEIFDDILFTAECRVLTTLGCSVSSLKKYGMRQAFKPTMFFMQDCSMKLYNNLLKINWKPNLLSNMVVLCGNYFMECKELVDSKDSSIYQPNKILRNFLSDYMGHVLAAQRFTNEFKFKMIFDVHHQTFQDSSCWKDYYDAFYHSTWHFFGPVAETDLQFMNEVIQKGDIVG